MINRLRQTKKSAPGYLATDLGSIIEKLLCIGGLFRGMAQSSDYLPRQENFRRIWRVKALSPMTAQPVSLHEKHDRLEHLIDAIIAHLLQQCPGLVP